MLEITTLGGLSIKRNGELVTELASHKVEALLVYLACAGRPVAREQLAKLLWRTSTHERATRNLQAALTNLRKHLGDYLTITPETVALNHEAGVRLDVADLEEHLRAGHIAPALDLYQGAFLEGFAARGAPAFKMWVGQERQRLRRKVVDAVQALAAKQLAGGELRAATDHLQRLLDLDPPLDAALWREALWEAVRHRDAGEPKPELPQLDVSSGEEPRWLAERERARVERERLLADARAQARRQAALFRLSAELAAALEEDDICQRVVQGLHETLGYDVQALFLLDEATGNRDLVASVGYVDPVTPLLPGEGLSELALLEGRLRYTADVSQAPQYAYGMGGSEVDVPVRIAGKVGGVLIAESRRTDAFDEDDFEVLTAGAQQAGLAIAKARLLAAERKRGDELDALHSTMADITAELELPALLQAIVERAARLLDATGGELGLYDEASRELRIVVSHNLGQDYVGRRHALGEGAMGRVAETGEPLIIEDYHAWAGGLPEYSHVHATLATPLMVGDRLVGVFTTVSTDPSRRFSAADLHLLSLFAHQASIAIENARLYDQAQREIAERTQAQEELREYQEHLEELVEERTADLRQSEARYRTLFDGVPVGLYRTTPEGRILDTNLAQVQMLGYPSREHLLAVNSANLYAEPEERVRWQALMERPGVVRDFQTQFRRYDGTIIWVNDIARAVRDEQGRVLYYEGSIEDITERKRAEAELREYQEHLEELVAERTARLGESEQRYRTLFDGVPIGLYRTTPEGKPIVLNQAAVQMLGYSGQEEALLAMDLIDLYVNREDRARWQDLMEREGIIRDFETRLQRRDGTNIWVNDSARVVRDEQGQVLYYEGSLEEITTRKEFEDEIRRRKEYYEALFVNNPVAVVTADLNGDIVSWSPMAEQLFGYESEEVIGRDLDDIVCNDDSIRAEGAAYTNQVLTTGNVRETTRRTRKDGSLVDVELLALPVIVAGERVGFIAIYHDITDLVKARREAEAANEAKSNFLANMSHELRTPLNAILGFSQLMEGQPNLTGDQQEYLGIINRNGENLLGLINDVLEMSKIEAGMVTLQNKSFDLHHQLDGLEEAFRLRAEQKGLDLTFMRDETVPRFIVSDEGKIGQVLSNLLGNAVKFTQEGAVTLRVTVPSAPRRPQETRATLRFEVEDTGPGISAEELPTIFEAFVQSETGRASRVGTGLGLTISQQFVHLLGGELTVESQLGRGSLFAFDVQVEVGAHQAAEAEPARARRRVIGLEPGQPTYRLLVAEDRETSRRLLVDLLAPMGFEVQEAANGQQAIDLSKSWEPHLIWIDMRMPVVDGYQATRQIKAAAGSQAPVIIALTASAFEEERQRILAAGCDAFVRKPFRKEEIFDKLAQHLEVRFVYEDEPAEPARPEEGAAGVGLPKGVTAADLAQLPAGLVADLKQATIRADLVRIIDLSEEIRGQAPAVADALAELARNFQYQQILDWIERAGRDEASRRG